MIWYQIYYKGFELLSSIIVTIKLLLKKSWDVEPFSNAYVSNVTKNKYLKNLPWKITTQSKKASSHTRNNL